MSASARLLVAILVTNGALPIVAQPWVKDRLDQSPRHLEWITLTHGDRRVECFVAFPEVAEKATAVVVIHEIFGLSDWVRGVADQLAEQGYIAIAPDLLSGMGPDGGGTTSLGSGDDVRRVIMNLPPDQITADLTQAAEYVARLPASNGKVAVTGFCWGGSQAFRFATNNHQILAAYPFYGTAPDSADDLGRITCPVYGFYGEMDARVNATLPRTVESMKVANKHFEPVTYVGAGHGFMRTGEAPDASPADREGRDAAWKRLVRLMSRL